MASPHCPMTNRRWEWFWNGGGCPKTRRRGGLRLSKKKGEKVRAEEMQHRLDSARILTVADVCFVVFFYPLQTTRQPRSKFLHFNSIIDLLCNVQIGKLNNTKKTR